MTKPSKKLQTIVQQIVNPSSIRDAGQMAARAGDHLERVANWCLANVGGFPNDVSKEDRALFKEGCWVHYETIKAKEYYRREGKNLVKLDSEPEKLTPDIVVLSVLYCTGMTGQAYGGLKATDPALYDAVTAYRDDCNTYAGNRWGKVKRFVEKKRGPRGAPDPFKDRMGKIFDTMAKSIKVARDSRGDATAPSDELFKRAVKAFWTTLAS